MFGHRCDLTVKYIGWKCNYNCTEKVSPSCVVCACFLTVCYSNSQGQSAAKRQGKFKKVLNVSFWKRYT